MGRMNGSRESMTKSTQVVLFAVVVTAFQAIGSASAGSPSADSTLATRYRWLLQRQFPFEEQPAERAALPIDSLVIEREPCFGLCPAYRAVLRRDGHAEFLGKSNAPREGVRSGVVTLLDYGRLCYLAETLGISDLNSRYVDGPT